MTTATAEAPRPSTAATPTAGDWDARLHRLAVLVGRLGLAYLFFTQLFWKLPPAFGCGEGFAFTAVAEDGSAAKGEGLCHWLGVQSVWSTRDRSLLVTDLNNDGSPDIQAPLGWAVALNGSFVESVVRPNIGLFGWLVFLAEAFIVVSMLFGLLTRLGALVSLGLSIQLGLGLGGVYDDVLGVHEWEWTYHLMVLLSVVLLGVAPGRVLGVDAWLRPRLVAAWAAGSRAARWLLAMT
jgi:hypothetical protein